MKKRISILALALTVCLLLAACAGGAASSVKLSSSAASVAASSQAASSKEENKTLYPVEGSPELSLLMIADSNVQTAGYKDQSETELYKYWQEQTGINLKVEVVVDYPAMVLALQSGTYPDMLLMYKGSYTGGMSGLIKDEVAVNLLDYKEQIPDYYKLLQSNEAYMKAATEADGGIYAFLNLIAEDNQSTHWAGMVVRQDFLDQAKLKVPTTNQEFHDMLVSFRDDLGCDVPLMCNWWTRMLDDGFCTTEYGLVSATAFQKDGKYHYGAYDEEYRGALTYMNQLYTESLFDANFQTTDEPTSQASLLNGETGAHFTSCARINTITQKATDSSFKLVAVGSLNASNGTKAMFTQTDTLTPDRACGFISADCKDKKAAAAFWNWLYTEDGCLTANFGTKDLCWTMKDNTPTFTEYMTNNSNGLSLDNMLYVQSLGNGPHLVLGSQSLQRFAMPEQRDALSIWDKTDSTTYLLPTYTITDEAEQKEATDIWTDVSTYITESRANFITGKWNTTTDFDAYIAQLKSMKMDRYIEIQQKALDAYYKK